MANVPAQPPPTYQEAEAGQPGQYSAPQAQPGYGYSQPQYGEQPQGYRQPLQSYPQPHGYTQPAPQNYGQPEVYDADEQNAFNANSFSDKVIRNRFIRNVYLILMCQLLFTTALVAIFVAVKPVQLWVRTNSWFYYISYATFFVTYIVLACCPSVRRKFPGNYIALFVFTAAFSYVCAAIASFHEAEAVLIAAAITAGVAFSVSLFAIQTKIDFTMCYGLMFAACMTLLFMGFAMIIIYAVGLPGGHPKSYYYLQCVYGGIAALILCLFLVFDTQRIVGGKNRKNPVSPEEHILGAMELYLDIVYLFLIILSFFGGRD